MPALSVIAIIGANKVRSLIWSGDSLIDWVGGGQRFELDGTIERPRVRYPYRFDSAIASSSGQYVVIYEKLGTKGLLLKNGDVVREINRSYYCANAYEYPLCFAELPSGREALIHCPEQYCRIDIDDAETGERLTGWTECKPADFFHSRLSVDPRCRWLISAGWFWHPFGALRLFSVAEAIEDPASLDASTMFPNQPSEVSTATFAGDNTLLITSSEESLSNGDVGANELPTNSVCTWDIAARAFRSIAPVTEPPGNVMPFDTEYAVAFYKHPKIINLRTGEITCRMPELDCGVQTSSILHFTEKQPTYAIDVANNRFAVASDDQIVVVQVTDSNNHCLGS